MDEQQRRVAVIGAGIISARHVEAALGTEGLEPCAVADIMPERAQQLADRFGIAAYGDYRDMIEREKPDIAVIALPHFLHREAAEFCASRGCHIMLEKPMALNTEECDAIAAAARRGGVRLMVGHTQHYHAENIRARDIVRSGELGRLVMINDVRHLFYFKDERPAWFFERAKAGGGIMANLGTHSIDKIQWLTGSRVRRIKAAVGRPGLKGDIEGSGVLFLDLDGGVPATVSQSGYPGVSRNETELIFTGGMLKLATGKGLWISRGGEYEPVEVRETARPFVLQFRDLLAAIREGREPECSAAYGRSVIAALEAVYRSAETGREQEVGGAG